MGPERGQVRGLVEEPESFPVVAGLAEVFRVDEQLFDSLGLIGRIVRQGDRCTSLAQGEDATRRAMAAKGFRISGSSRLADRSDRSAPRILRGS